MKNFRSTLGLARNEEPSRFKITCTGNRKAGPNVISFEIEAQDAKEAVKAARQIIMLGRFAVEPS